MTLRRAPVGAVRGGRSVAIDGTPVLDIEPALIWFPPRGEVREPAWAGEIMKNDW